MHIDIPIYIHVYICIHVLEGFFHTHTHAPVQIGMESVTITLSVSTTDEGLERALQGRNSQNSKYTTQNDCRSVL